MSEDRVKVREFRMRLAAMVAGVQSRPVEVMSHGNRAAVLVSPSDYDELKMLRRQVYTTIGKPAAQR